MLNPFGVKVNGSPIGDYNFRPSVATITYTLAYEQEQSRIYAGMSTVEYDALPGTPQWINPETGGRSKCDILILYRMSNAIPAAASDAAAKEMERNAHRPH